MILQHCVFLLVLISGHFLKERSDIMLYINAAKLKYNIMLSLYTHSLTEHFEVYLYPWQQVFFPDLGHHSKKDTDVTNFMWPRCYGVLRSHWIMGCIWTVAEMETLPICAHSGLLWLAAV